MQLIAMLITDTKLTFKYDYSGRRVEKNVFNREGENWIQVENLRYVYDKHVQIEKMDALNQNTALYYYTWNPVALGFSSPLSVIDINRDTDYSYLLDANKNILAVCRT